MWRERKGEREREKEREGEKERYESLVVLTVVAAQSTE